MEIINAEDMSDEQWKSYARLCNDIEKKHESYRINKEIFWEELKRDRLSEIECLKQDYHTFYLLSENDEAIGWVGLRLSGKEAGFVFYALYDVVPDNVKQTVFKILLKFISERDKNEIHCASKSEGINNFLTGAGAEIIDCKIFAKLNRIDIDEKKLQKLIESVSGKINYKLILYDTIPEKMLDTYLEIYNEAREDMNQYNPDKIKVEKRSKEELIRKLKSDKAPDDKRFVYMLIDNKYIAAFCSLYIREENKHIIDQADGLTAVGRKYRGQNLAGFLKAKMYLKMLEEFPEFEFIRTDTYPWNKFMYKINQEMGFKPYEKYIEIKLKKSEILKFLKHHAGNI